MNATLDLAQVGLVYDLDIDDYHQGVGLSKSGLDLIARSPARFYAMRLNPNRPPERDRAGQLEGSLAHCAILEPEHFSARYCVLPADAPRRPTEVQWKAKNPSDDSRAAMDWWREFSDRIGARVVISADQYEVAMRQAESVRTLPDVAEALGTGRAEVSAFWNDTETGVLCKCRPDWVYPVADTGAILLDVKTYSDASPDEFRRQVARKAYHKQAAFYTDGYAQAARTDVLAFVFLAVETEYPYAASAVMLDEQSIDQGRYEYRTNVYTYARCIESGIWPGYSTGIETVSLPNWAFKD